MFKKLRFVPPRPVIMKREDHDRKYYICECGGSNLRSSGTRPCKWCGKRPLSIEELPT
jgi:hypothetical protein